MRINGEKERKKMAVKKTAKNRLMPMGMPKENFKLGDTLKEESYEF